MSELELRRAAEWLVKIHADDVAIPHGSALWEDLQSLKAALDEGPVYLGCGCLGGDHDNTMEALHEAHPDVLGWEHTGPFYGGMGRAIG